MLKKIPVTELRLGMYVHALEGTWLDHPFWRARFALDDEHQLRRVQECGVAQCWIDVSLGADVASPVASEAVAEAAVTVGLAAGMPPATSSGGGLRAPMSAELREAAAICRRGLDAVHDMFAEARMGRAVDADRSRALVEEVTASV